MEKNLERGDLADQLFENYGGYRENLIKASLIHHDDIKNILSDLGKSALFKVEEIGRSVEGREIFSITFGTGKTDILAWSQMHGDEPTATAALFDLLKFFSACDSFDPLRKELLSKLKFHFIPMLNPDGARLFQRENAFNIDINRDALRLESNESKLLWNYAEKADPEFCFNLHDQNSYYTSGRSGKHSTISLLAPPSDHLKSINYAREKSMQVILKIEEALKKFIPGGIARYSDDHEPRSFGDNFIKNGRSSILIESGYFKSDPDKEFVRKLNFISLITAFVSIAGRDFEKINYTEYFNIPENQEMLFDLLLRNLILKMNGSEFKIDIGINRKKKYDPATKKFFYSSTIQEVGDLSFHSGIEEYNFENHIIISSGKIAADEPADLVLTGREKVVIKNGFIIKD